MALALTLSPRALPMDEVLPNGNEVSNCYTSTIVVLENPFILTDYPEG